MRALTGSQRSRNALTSGRKDLFLKTIRFWRNFQADVECRVAEPFSKHAQECTTAWVPSHRRTSGRPLRRAPHRAGTFCPTRAPCQSAASSATCLSCPRTAAGPSTSSCSCMPHQPASQRHGRCECMSPDGRQYVCTYGQDKRGGACSCTTSRQGAV